SVSSETNLSGTEIPLPGSSRKKGLRTSGEQVIPADESDVLRKRRQKLALRYVHTHGSITNKQYSAMTGISEHVAQHDLEALREKGSLRAVDQKHSRRYVL